MVYVWYKYLLLSPSTRPEERLMFHCQHWICHFLHQKNIFHIIIILKIIKYLSVRHLGFFAVDLDFDFVKESESSVKVCVSLMQVHSVPWSEAGVRRS